MRERQYAEKRITKETVISVKLNIDGSGETKISSKIGFMDHMLELFAFWGKFDLEITTEKADTNVDIHHLNEDLGIVLGQGFKTALGDKAGINRNGFASFPMEDTTANVTVDLSGRASLKFNITPEVYSIEPQPNEGYEFKYAEHFFAAFAKQLGMNLNIRLENPNLDLHASLEPVFKALGKALGEAAQIDPRRKGVPSTKGILD